MALAVDGAGDHLGLADGQLESLTAHLLHEDRQRQLAAPLDLPGVGPGGGQDPQGHVADELTVQAVLDLTGGDLGALGAPGHRGGVDADGHGDGGVVHGDERQRAGVLGVHEGLADGDVLDPGDGDDVTGVRLLGGLAVQALGDEELGDAGRGERTVVAGPGHRLALAQGAVVNAQQRQAPQEGRGVQVGDVGLQRRALLVGGTGDPLDDGAEERLEVLTGRQLAVGRGLGAGTAGLGGGVDDRDVQDGVEVDVGVLVGQVAGQGQQQVGGLCDDLVEPGVGTVHLVDHEDDRQVRGQGLAQHEAGLGQGPLGGVDEEDDAVDHGQPALDLTAEVGVTGGVDDVDDDALGAAGVHG